MALFSSQIDWRGMGTIVVVGLIVLFALALSVTTYIEVSSDNSELAAPRHAAFDATRTSGLSAENPSGTGQSGCPRGKKPLPTELMPLP
jgi:hypothetical protein